MHKSLKRKLMLLSLPAVIGFVMFYIVPFVRGVGFSFIDNNYNRNFVGLENYKAVISNQYFRLAVKNTLIFSVVGVSVLVVLSLILSVGLVKLSNKFSAIKSAYIMPYVLPTASIIFIWKLIFDSDCYFVLTQLENWKDFIDILPLYLLFIWKNVGIDIILLTAALSKIPQEVYEAASLDGAHGLKTHMKITLPLISPSLFFVVVLSFVNALKIFKESFLYYNTNYPPDPAYLIQNYLNNHFYKLNYQNLSAATVMFTVVAGLVIYLLYRLESKTDDISD